LIDDSKSSTIAYVTTVGAKSTGDTMTEKAVWAGKEMAKKAKTAKITKVVFDRNGKLFHGRIKALAEAAREAGLEF
jgi:large subunit ribosomal protein L18